MEIQESLPPTLDKAAVLLSVFYKRVSQLKPKSVNNSTKRYPFSPINLPTNGEE